MLDSIVLSPIVTLGMQIRVLDTILRKIDLVSRTTRSTPIVEIDLDLTAVCPRIRTSRALAAAGKVFDVPEIVDPSRLTLLPGYTQEAWQSFLEQTGLGRRYPSLPWVGAPSGEYLRSIYSEFHRAYWTTEWLVEDEPTPGLGEFVRRVEGHGGLVVFLSGRWLQEQVDPTLTVLKRAGIADPRLIIGNPHHETLIGPGERALSDSDIKRLRQSEIYSKYGIPVAVIDDRQVNRQAVINGAEEYTNGIGMLDIGISIPGFSFDPAIANAGLRISTFEGLTTPGPDPLLEPYIYDRYSHPSNGEPYIGLLTGLGRNSQGYVLPRIADARLDLKRISQHGPPPFAQLIATSKAHSLSDDEFMVAVAQTIPMGEKNKLENALKAAEEQARQGLASPFPDTAADRLALEHALNCSWLHSRDLEFMMAALGYPLRTTGIHDLEEDVPTSELINAIEAKQKRGLPYSKWFVDWIESTRGKPFVNIGFLNPNLTVGTWRWNSAHPELPQDAMDAHRVSSHHEGNGAQRYDPVEGTANNLLHAREGIHGVQKSPVMSWTELSSHLASRTSADQMAKSSWGGAILHDAIELLWQLESAGFLMPWSLVIPTNRPR